MQIMFRRVHQKYSLICLHANHSLAAPIFKIDRSLLTQPLQSDILPTYTLQRHNRITTRSASEFRSGNDRQWHSRNFLKDASTKEKEAWLESKLTNKEAVDGAAYLFVLNSLAAESSIDPGSPRRAERWMLRLKRHRNVDLSAEHYTAVIQAWANSSYEHPLVSVNRAERWIDDLLTESESNPMLYPSIECYNAFLDACTRGRNGKNKQKQDILELNAKKADSLLRKLHSWHHHNVDNKTLAPNTESFNFVIRGWSRCRKDSSAAQRILSLVRLMESYQRKNPHDSDIKPNTKTYVMAMDAVVSLGRMKARQSMTGSWQSDSSLNGLEEIREAENILSYMHDLFDAGVDGVVPNQVAYNVLLSGWAMLAGQGHHSAPFEAEQLMLKMLSFKDNGFEHANPDRLSYEKVMLAWANSGLPNAGQRASWWLKQMSNHAEVSRDPALLPTTLIYNTVMKAVASSEGAEATESILRDLGERFRRDGSDKLCPNSESFSIVIRAWLRQVDQDPETDGQFEALQRAMEWLASVRDVEGEQNLSTAPDLFLSVLKAAEKCCRRRPDVLELATKVMEDFRKSRHGANHSAFTTLLSIGLKVFSGLQDVDTRKSFLTKLLKDCADDGLVSRSFVQGIANSPVYYQGWTIEESSQLTSDLFSEWPLPSPWTRNVPKRLLPQVDDVERTNFKILGDKYRDVF